MASLHITHLRLSSNGGWYLLFAGTQDDFVYMRSMLKSRSKGPYKVAWFEANFPWDGRARNGAWWVDESLFIALQFYFTNTDEMLETAAMQGPYKDDALRQAHDDRSYSRRDYGRQRSYGRSQGAQVDWQKWWGARMRTAPTTIPSDVESAFHQMGLPTNATREQVKATYREMAIKLDPNRGGTPGMIDRLNQVKATLDRWMDSQDVSTHAS